MTMVLLGNLAYHPAAAAWRKVAPTASAPEHIEVLRQGRGTGVYRLVGVGPGGAPIIARRTRKSLALVAHLVHLRILPRLLRAAPRYCACWVENPRCAWVFLQEGGGGGP